MFYHILVAHDISDQTSKELKTTQKEVKAHQKSQACVCANLEKLTQKLSKTTAINVEEDGDLEKIQDKLCAVVAQKEKCQASANQRKRQKVSYEKVNSKYSEMSGLPYSFTAQFIAHMIIQNHKRVNPLILEDKIRNSTVFQRRLVGFYVLYKLRYSQLRYQVVYAHWVLLPQLSKQLIIFSKLSKNLWNSWSKVLLVPRTLWLT